LQIFPKKSTLICCVGKISAFTLEVPIVSFSIFISAWESKRLNCDQVSIQARMCAILLDASAQPTHSSGSFLNFISTHLKRVFQLYLYVYITGLPSQTQLFIPTAHVSHVLSNILYPRNKSLPSSLLTISDRSRLFCLISNTKAKISGIKWNILNQSNSHALLPIPLLIYYSKYCPDSILLYLRLKLRAFSCGRLILKTTEV
jgi:hypothetical protein